MHLSSQAAACWKRILRSDGFPQQAEHNRRHSLLQKVTVPADRGERVNFLRARIIA
jgi:hypothetical protein